MSSSRCNPLKDLFAEHDEAGIVAKINYAKFEHTLWNTDWTSWSPFWCMVSTTITAFFTSAGPENFGILPSQLLGSLYSTCRTKSRTLKTMSVKAHRISWSLPLKRDLISRRTLGNKSWCVNGPWQLMWAVTRCLTNEGL